MRLSWNSRPVTPPKDLSSPSGLGSHYGQSVLRSTSSDALRLAVEPLLSMNSLGHAYPYLDQALQHFSVCKQSVS